MKKKAIIVSGYFNPLHKGHVEYFHLAKSKGNELFVIVNNDFQRNYNLYFANGGDQNNEGIPEKFICDKLGIKLIDGLGNKIQSSSWLLNSDHENN